MILLLACSPTEVVLESDDFDDFVAFIGDERVATEGRGVSIAFDTSDCATPGCFDISGNGDDWTVGGDRLGQQYGAAYLLEEMGFRFHHPHHSYAPEELFPLDPEVGTQEPAMARRGIHMHTLHPIEGYFDAWEDPDSEGGRRIVDWLIKNRGNHLQWVGLDEMPPDWEKDTQALVEYGHDRGITFGLGVQLYGKANLQLAFDLVDDEDADQRPQMEQQWARVTGVDFDLYNLSFGEFSDTEPEAFLASIDLAYEVMREQSDAEMTTVLHVGDDLQVEYGGETMIYYLLAQFANPEITPWVHTVMFYNLFEDAGGAYHHEEFDQHRELILERLSEGQPVGYFPESAYWVAFDNSVPQAQPLYIRSRWTDLANLPNLDDHVLFSSGWEWGFWQHDVATLRMNWAVPDAYEDTVRWMWEPWGDDALAQAVIDLAEAQHDALMDEDLAAWVCGRDNIMEVGYGLGIVSQPRRPDFDELTVEEHGGLAQKLRSHGMELALIEVPDREDPWVDELRDGVDIDAERALFMASLVDASIEGSQAHLDTATASLAQARKVVDRRHSALWDPSAQRLITKGRNNTLYDFGYLLRADELCYWERELLQVTELVTGDKQTLPGCSI
jgi:hypothetical protein